ncbi:hypothetical protein JKP88DRAFT_215237 [Tribonema minus]|uniref:Uncharacterized protein n=1 Tax=Tribonema minus TaxID=303371 RepID=A0A835YTJ3_9STRA|nr:hypothetical protein JKP88DRAFT_215237 [Tribonema minus]
MKAALFTAAAALASQHVDAFVVPGAPSLTAVRAGARSVALAMAEKNREGEVFVVSEITEGNVPNKFQEEFMDKGVATTEDTWTAGDANAGPQTYTGLVDGDTFDGGDGQVGCVGDGDNALDKFDSRSVVKGATMVKESKARQMNAWGSSTGYAESLKEKGMQKIINGEDMLAVRRQQLENWRNQQELQASQRAKIQQLDAITGQENNPVGWKRGASRSYMDNLSGGAPAEESAWNEFKPPTAADAKSDGTSWDHVKLTGKEKITATVQCISSSGRPGYATINVKNSVMTFEPFHAEYVGEAEGFGVDPKTGTLNRRSGEAIPVQVSFKANGPGDARNALLVIETEEDKWVYEVEGRSD